MEALLTGILDGGDQRGAASFIHAGGFGHVIHRTRYTRQNTGILEEFQFNSAGFSWRHCSPH